MCVKGFNEPFPGKGEKVFGHLKVEAGYKLVASGQSISLHVPMVKAVTSLVSPAGLGSWHSCCPRELAFKVISCRTSTVV